MATGVKSEAVSGTIELSPNSKDDKKVNSNGAHPERVTVEGVFESQLREGDGPKRNALISMGQIVLGPPEHRPQWDREFAYWHGELKKVDPNTAESYSRRYLAQRNYIGFYRD